MTQHLWCPDYSDCGAVTGIQTLLTAQSGYMLSVATCYQSANSKESALLPRDSARSYRLGAIGPECLTVSLHGHHAVFGHPHSPLLTRGNLHLHWNQQARGPGLLMPGKIVRPVSLKALHESIRLLPSLEPRHCVDGVPTGKPIKRNRFRIVVQVLHASNCDWEASLFVLFQVILMRVHEHKLAAARGDELPTCQSGRPLGCAKWRLMSNLSCRRT